MARAVEISQASSLRRGLIGSWRNALTTLLVGVVAMRAALALFDWAVIRASLGTTPESCRAGTGACWSVIAEMWPLFMVGLYPEAERWRIVVVALIVAGMALALAFRSLRRWRILGPLAVAATLAIAALVHGGALVGLARVETQLWGGLLLTAILAVVGQSLALPLGIVLALARRSATMPIVRAAATAYIELVRSVPLVMILLMATLILPLFLPHGTRLDTLMTAQIGIILFSAATIAEVVRGGLQGVPKDQVEAAQALGLGYWSTTALVVLPQALRLVLPALVNTLITFIKGSSLVVAIGMYDLLGAAMLVSANERWVGRTVEPLLFVALIYWLACYGLSRASRRLERRYGRASGGGTVR